MGRSDMKFKGLDQVLLDKLAAFALKARENAYAPYSGYLVGAALITADGKIYTGCNIENISFGATNCAERTAIFKAVSEGERAFAAIAIAGGVKDKEITGYASPCGICRQVLAEFTAPEFPVILVKSPSEYKVISLGELMPCSFEGDFSSAVNDSFKQIL